MKIAISVLTAGAFIAVALYAGLTDARRTYMEGCLAMAARMGQSEEFAKPNCAFRYKD